MIIDSKNTKIKNNKKDKCLACQSDVTYKAHKRFPKIKL